MLPAWRDPFVCSFLFARSRRSAYLVEARNPEERRMLNKRTGRRPLGNMLILVCVTMTLLLMGLMVLSSFGGAFMAQTILQNWANEIALGAAGILNGGNAQEQANGVNACDRIGQMNNMIVRSRSMVHESRSNFETAGQGDDPELVTLASQLLDEARQSARDLDQERMNLRQVSESEAIVDIVTRVGGLSTYKLILPWIQCSSPRLITGNCIQFGQVKNVPSNVSRLDVSNNLQQDDRDNSYLLPNNRYYMNNINAKLQGPDADLNFHLSSLQPPVKNEVVQARLVLPAAFTNTPNTDLTSTVRVTLIMDVETRLGCVTRNLIKVSGYATTIGGGAMR